MGNHLAFSATSTDSRDGCWRLPFQGIHAGGAHPRYLQSHSWPYILYSRLLCWSHK
jgi:hypothetical protein